MIAQLIILYFVLDDKMKDINFETLKSQFISCLSYKFCEKL